eukprot:m.30634 g.30634  ORF g.30634 m.30634 type:complete len:171 (+) comp41277_c0_seq4:101-613(+)
MANAHVYQHLAGPWTWSAAFTPPTTLFSDAATVLAQALEERGIDDQYARPTVYVLSFSALCIVLTVFFHVLSASGILKAGPDSWIHQPVPRMRAAQRICSYVHVFGAVSAGFQDLSHHTWQQGYLASNTADQLWCGSLSPPLCFISSPSSPLPTRLTSCTCSALFLSDLA